MAEPTTDTREKTPLRAVDKDAPSVLALREEVAGLRAELAGLRDAPSATLTAIARSIAVLQQATDEYCARLEWFVRMGAKMRTLLEDLSPDTTEDAMPDLGSVLAAAAAAPGKGATAPARAGAAKGLPPELAQALAGILAAQGG